MNLPIGTAVRVKDGHKLYSGFVGVTGDEPKIWAIPVRPTSRPSVAVMFDAKGRRKIGGSLYGRVSVDDLEVLS